MKQRLLVSVFCLIGGVGLVATKSLATSLAVMDKSGGGDPVGPRSLQVDAVRATLVDGAVRVTYGCDLGTVTCTLENAAGQTVCSHPTNTELQREDWVRTAGLPAGTYQFVCTTANGVVLLQQQIQIF